MSANVRGARGDSYSMLPFAAVLVLALGALVELPRLAAAAGSGEDARLPVSAVGAIGMTVSDMERSLDFYTRVLPFRLVSDIERSGRDFEILQGVFGARARIATLQLGDESITLTEYLAPRGRPIPEDLRAHDAVFQHVAIVVSDMARAYDHLRRAGVAHGSTGPQRLPDWNVNAGGIEAFYFKDPDRHYLEIIHFPADKGSPRWRRQEALFLGIDHTAIVSADTERSLRFYRDLLRMQVAGESENFDTEQEHLNNVFGARLRITALRAGEGPGIELLEYLAPRTGRPAPLDLAANDLAHWQTTLVTEGLDAAPRLARRHLLSLVSPFAVRLDADAHTTATEGDAGAAQSLVVRDPDAHALQLVSRRVNAAAAASRGPAR